MGLGEGRTNGFSSVSVAIISVLLTSVVALMIALGSATRTTTYDRDQAFIKASIQENAQSISELTKTVNQLAVAEAATQQQVDGMLARKSP